MSDAKYWVGARPWDGKRLGGMQHGVVLDGDGVREDLFRMYRRYVKQWNDIELDRTRSLSEHTHLVHGAQVVGANRRFGLNARSEAGANWALDLIFARGFQEFYPGLSAGRNTLRTSADIRSIHLHWSGEGRQAFERWLKEQQITNTGRGEWTEYRTG